MPAGALRTPINCLMTAGTTTAPDGAEDMPGIPSIDFSPAGAIFFMSICSMDMPFIPPISPGRPGGAETPPAPMSAISPASTGAAETLPVSIIPWAVIKPTAAPAITPIATAPTMKFFLYPWWFICSSLFMMLALAIESNADDLLKFSQSLLAIHEGFEIFKLKSLPGPLRFNEIENPCFAGPIPHTCRLQSLLSLWQDRGAVQRGHLIDRSELGQEVIDLKPSDVFYGMLLRPRDRNPRRCLLHTRVILRLSPERKRDTHRHVGAESVVGLIVLEALERHVEVRVILTQSQRMGLLVPLYIQLGSFDLRPVVQRQTVQILYGLIEGKLRGFLHHAQWCCGTPIEQRIQHRLRRFPVLIQDRTMLEQER